MDRRNFFRRLAAGLAAVLGATNWAKAGPAQTWSVSTKGSRAYAGHYYRVVSGGRPRLTLNEVRAREGLA